MKSLKDACTSSPSSRRAWIEIFHGLRTRQDSWVALLAEGVDRNIGGLVNWPSEEVALLAEGVDRNQMYHAIL